MVTLNKKQQKQAATFETCCVDWHVEQNLEKRHFIKRWDYSWTVKYGVKNKDLTFFYLFFIYLIFKVLFQLSIK